MTNAAFNDLITHVKQTSALSRVAGHLSWDQETMMPRNGVAARAEEAATLAGVIHDRRADPAISDWLAAVDADALAPEDAADIRLIRRSHARAARVPTALATKLAHATSAGQAVWAEARAANSFADFAPTLSEIIALKREEAAHLADGGDLYDALIDDFEPGATAAWLGETLGALRDPLAALIDHVRGRPQPDLKGEFAEAAQMALARAVAGRIGFDWDGGRLDLSVHPFTSGDGDDVRITTRVDPANPFDCLYSTLHEVGHALYAQGLPSDRRGRPSGEAVSMGVHESQSRFWENQIGRGRPFCGWLYDQAQAAFGDIAPDADTFHRLVNRVQDGFIRTEADELQYNLHILLRFELERELIAGDLSVDDLEGEWNTRFARDFGRTPPTAALGVLQDVHWSCGLFGYFPTYALGNIYAAELTEALRRDLPDLDDMAAKAETAPVLDWMRTHIHQPASTDSPQHTVTNAIGHTPTAAPLLSYLKAKFTDLF